MLLQVLDDGRLTDSHGRTVSFKNTVIIMTSNAPKDALKDIFRPEFLNRLDEVLEFAPLTEAEIGKIVDLQIKGLADRLAAQDFRLEVDDAARKVVMRDGYDPAYGARPVKRAIQRLVETPAARKIVAGDYPPGAVLKVTAQRGEILLQ